MTHKVPFSPHILSDLYLFSVRVLADFDYHTLTGPERYYTREYFF